ncbi:DEAD/DEAH box helicase [Nocardia sp. NPDC004068]|uniref:DEAD/DEAH box helicase n=1 Tax=Nocardia sp. NPDC004068 TaxID=3364303 RepID=UPI0036BE6059
MAANEVGMRLLRFWRALEMFGPQDVPDLDDAPARRRSPADSIVLDLAETQDAPWEADHWLQRRTPLAEGKIWQFTVYGGLYGTDTVRDRLVAAFGPDDKEPDGRRAGTTAMFAFTLDAQGSLVAGSPVLSACAWAMSRLRQPGPKDPKWLNGFSDDARAFAAALDQLAPPRPEEKGAPRSVLGRTAAAAKGRARPAAVDAVAKGAGTAAGAAAIAGATALGGPVLGGIAGALASTFVEKMLAYKPPAAGSPEPGNETENAFRFTARSLHELVKDLSGGLDIAESLGVSGVRVKCVQVSARYADEANDQGFLNSYIAEDLARIENALREDNVGPALRAYLADVIDVGTRVDVRSRPDVVVAGVAPTSIPGGRWPTDLRKPLVLSQQFAVNSILAERNGAAAVFAVNGPPGTGKTTMLRDLLAALVVERARCLATLDNPQAAFTDRLDKVQYGESENNSWSVHGLRYDITGYEIVLATASNNAAANVTAEIPAVSAVAEAGDEALAADYFTELASRVLGAKAWGLVAAVLGNMSNRRQFVGRFWYGNEPREGGNRQSRPLDGEPGQSPADEHGMLRTLGRAVNGEMSVPEWGVAVRAFNKAADELRTLVSERQRICDSIVELDRLNAGLDAAAQDIENADASQKYWRAKHSEVEAEAERAERELGDVNKEIAEHNSNRPGFWVSLSTWFRAGREWNEESKRLTARRKLIRTELETSRRSVFDCATEWAKAADEGRRCVEVHKELVAVRQSMQDVIDAARKRWPDTVPIRTDTADDERLQLLAPWADEQFTAARNRLFLEALRLHKAFLLNAAPRVRGNLGAAMTLISGQVRNKPSAAALAAAWQTVFLVVPMVSTTFASLPRLFDTLGREALGWLFIDEAGQATPQQAVGGLWRTRRAVIVGDPQQLEPIVTLPVRAQQKLLEHYDVDRSWLPDSTSAQRAADRLARYGTTLSDPDSEFRAWVGTPLRVHRRCDRPMFEVSNRIAYGGDLMVYGTPSRPPFVGDNTWFDVRSERADGNWVHAEGEQLRQLLDQLVNGMGLEGKQIRIISPFRDVVRGAQKIARQVVDSSFAKSNVGTVHTVQGQESDVVILVLGTPRAKGGARRWAASKPNLLNVGVSRAKRRFYVIGDYELWTEQQYFNALGAALRRSMTGF